MKFSRGESREIRRAWATAIPPNFGKVCEAHDWCKAQESPGGFYHHFTNTRWWFEFPEDAMHFSLRWSGQ